MHHATAVRRLRVIAERCQQVSASWPGLPRLVGAYAFGDVLDATPDIEVVDLAFVLDLPVDELTWWAHPPSCAAWPSVLEIDKAPVWWHWRPAEWPVGNHVVRRPLPLWSPDGPRTDALDALGRGEADAFRLPAPAAEQEHAQLTVELAAALAHLRRVEDGYWERDWRRTHRGSGVYPENHLWDATHGYLDLLHATESSHVR